jgi:hypothetical protein
LEIFNIFFQKIQPLLAVDKQKANPRQNGPQPNHSLVTARRRKRSPGGAVDQHEDHEAAQEEEYEQADGGILCHLKIISIKYS